MRPANCVPSLFSCRASGVSSLSCSATSAEILPISVRPPVATTTPSAVPVVIRVPEKSMEVRSPTPAPASTASTSFCEGTDSPVRAASSACSDDAVTSRRSAGTRSPERSRTMSPATSVAASTTPQVPSRSAWASCDCIV